MHTKYQDSISTLRPLFDAQRGNTVETFHLPFRWIFSHFKMEPILTVLVCICKLIEYWKMSHREIICIILCVDSKLFRVTYHSTRRKNSNWGVGFSCYFRIFNHIQMCAFVYVLTSFITPYISWLTLTCIRFWTVYPFYKHILALRTLHTYFKRVANKIMVLY